MELRAAGERTAGLTAAVIGAAVSRGASLSILDGLDGVALAERAALLVDPAPPRVEHPAIAEAIRRADELPRGSGRERLSRKLPRPERDETEPAPSAPEPSADAPGSHE